MLDFDENCVSTNGLVIQVCYNKQESTLSKRVKIREDTLRKRQTVTIYCYDGSTLLIFIVANLLFL